jgi:trans-aconitate methyltransferase
VADLVPAWLKPGLRVVDIGGGKHPCIGVERKRRLCLHVTGVDIDADELSRAPAGAYDRVVRADITRVSGSGDADLCICKALLEHVEDTERAFRAIVSFLKPGGVALVFVP